MRFARLPGRCRFGQPRAPTGRWAASELLLHASHRTTWHSRDWFVTGPCGSAGRRSKSTVRTHQVVAQFQQDGLSGEQQWHAQTVPDLAPPSLAAGYFRVRTWAGRSPKIVATRTKRRCSLEASIACFNAFSRLKSIRKRDATPGRSLHVHMQRCCLLRSRLRCRCWRFHSE